MPCALIKDLSVKTLLRALGMMQEEFAGRYHVRSAPFETGQRFDFKRFLSAEFRCENTLPFDSRTGVKRWRRGWAAAAWASLPAPRDLLAEESGIMSATESTLSETARNLCQIFNQPMDTTV